MAQLLTPGMPEDQAMVDAQKNIKHKIIVLSGKGGVGKSTVAVNLAVSLANQGNKVGLLDIDIHGPSVPKMLNLSESQVYATEDEKLIPVQYNDNLKVVSIGFLVPGEDDAVIWRAALKQSIMQQFVKDVMWEDLDYLIVDSPPGTGDEPLSIVQLLHEPDGAVIVTTPQDMALLDVRKSVTFCKKLNLPVIGVVENMNGFTCPHCGEVVNIFKTGGGEKMAKDMDVPFIGSIPIQESIVAGGDSGKPVVENDETVPGFAEITEKVVEYCK
jgi:ATP-binding protein involved in chromosome partitioning